MARSATIRAVTGPPVGRSSSAVYETTALGAHEWFMRQTNHERPVASRGGKSAALSCTRSERRNGRSPSPSPSTSPLAS
eukprot:4747293-Prymnesium_polylepis.1